MPAGGSVQAGFLISADGRSALYRADPLTNNVVELFRVSLDERSAPQRLSADLVAGGDVLSFAVSPDLGHVLYLADQRIDGTDELFSVPLDGARSSRSIPCPRSRT